MKLAALPIALAAIALLLVGGFGVANHASAAPGDPEFHIGVDTDGLGGDDCSTVGDAKGNCTVAAGSMFTVNAYLNDSGGHAYSVASVVLAYAGVTSKHNADMNVWLDCVNEVFAFPAGLDDLSCGIPSPGLSSYTGKVATDVFTCTADGTITIGNGTLIGDDFNTFSEAGPDVLNIDCVNPSLGGVAGYPDLGSGGSNAGFVLGGSALAALLLGAAAWRMRKVVRVR